MQYFTKSGTPIAQRDWHQKAIEMAATGLGATEIAEELLGRKSQESTIRDFLSKVDLSKAEKNLKILFWDIETSPALSAHWGEWQQNINKDAKVRDYGLLTHAWAWGDGEVVSSAVCAEDARHNEYQSIVHEMWALLDEADIVVAHNGAKFDIKRANAEFVKAGLPPPSPYKVYDTLKVAKAKFKFPRNDLESLCNYLGVEHGKLKNSGMPLWMKCITGCTQSLNEMEEYNRGDIYALRDVFYRLLPWDNQGINFGLYGDRLQNHLCTHCGSSELETLEGKYAYTSNNSYQVYRCSVCGAISRTRNSSGKRNQFMRIGS